MNPIVSYKTADGQFHLVTSESLVAYSVTRPQAVSILSRTVDGLNRETIDEILANPVDGQTWVATLRSALAADTMAVTAAVESMADSAEVDKLHARLDLLTHATESLNEEIKRQNDLAEAEQKRIEQQERERKERERQQRLAAERERAARERAELAKLDLKAKRSGDTVEVSEKMELKLQNGNTIYPRKLLYRGPLDQLPEEFRGLL